ncbi:16S rRNA pseudouridine(516) synthase RsuA [Bermanella marisrubri]|uniref:Pseudouridine synthase n=1 Tax=Bermanella marisrubri TaxID=207949 RepID=Q1N3J1_9GAMM|nr:16S rRNA pseudouridine(516) synthase RsuA [Bermanella marisrubri]EAT12883.1 ribosomal small subunit pseudouridine synthase [Oceanobacter sp. RED65] [Bermanella marisrubri]QIZ83202.1 16S rRNA pseudouridine(516) synthase RsuA [Bermanella marisrubri]
MRLDKFLANYSSLSRTEATKALKQKRVLVNGDLVKTGSHKVANDDQVWLDGRRIEMNTAVYFMMNKPANYLCANADPQHALVFDLIDEASTYVLHTVGRLDLDTTGLLLITDDGQWSHRLTSPKHHIPKTYRVWLDEPLVADAEIQCEQGLLLRSESKPTLPAELNRITDTEVLITISEGRYHQVKRMFAAMGNRVVRLHRERIGPLELDPNLAPGEYRSLTQQELDVLGIANTDL